ncbi:transposase [Deinococcus cavernae]|uniref:Transposase n=1 Tax=Deinococcus cavernae TaxID=2320857 RepID=A0A418VHU5_9DEIO|nr:transposase [Deinococcus cavernae]RJF75706.1 transposase [Deinococcus cavernae]
MNELKEPVSRISVEKRLAETEIKLIALLDPEDAQQWVRLLVETNADTRRVAAELRDAFGRQFLVVRQGTPLDIARQILGFMRRDVHYLLQDAFGVMVYVSDTSAALKKAHGRHHLNRRTFDAFTGGRLSIFPASDSYREMLRSTLYVRARGYHEVPDEDLDTLLESQRGIITRNELVSALSQSEIDFSWMLLPEGPSRGSYSFFVPFLGRSEDELYALVKARLEGVAHIFGLRVTELQPLDFARKYRLYGEVGEVTLLFYNAPSSGVTPKTRTEEQGMSPRSARRLIRADGGRRTMPGRMHSREFKLEVLEQIERKQKTTAQLCREHQLSPSLIHRWRKEVEMRGGAAFTDMKTGDQALERRIAELERYCGQLALENTILKKSLANDRTRSGSR